jgi:hypothetical protein
MKRNESEQSPEKPRKVVNIIALEDDDEEEDDVIPGPRDDIRKSVPKERSNGNSSNASASVGNSSRKSGIRAILNLSRRGKDGPENSDVLQHSNTALNWAGEGILASRKDLDLPPEEFAAGCNLLQAAARGDIATMENIIKRRPHFVAFRDYDRRTALHVSVS